MTTYDFSNEKAFQKAYGLRYQPDRYSGLEAARIGLTFRVKSHMIVEVDENQTKFKAGYYVVCPADASRLERAGYRIVPPTRMMAARGACTDIGHFKAARPRETVGMA